MSALTIVKTTDEMTLNSLALNNETFALADESLATIVKKMSQLPSVENVRAYTQAVNKIPCLTKSQELYLVTAFEERKQKQAAQILALTHFKLVVKIAKKFKGYGATQSDLIQEGNVGLLKGILRISLSKLTSVASYTTPWIQAEIQSFLLRMFGGLNFGSSANAKKVFFGLRSSLKKLFSLGLSKSQAISELSVQLEVSPSELEQALGFFSPTLQITYGGEPDEMEQTIDLPSDIDVQSDVVNRIDTEKKINWLIQQIESPRHGWTQREKEWLMALSNGTCKQTNWPALWGVSTQRVNQIEDRLLRYLAKEWESYEKS